MVKEVEIVNQEEDFWDYITPSWLKQCLVIGELGISFVDKLVILVSQVEVH